MNLESEIALCERRQREVLADAETKSLPAFIVVMDYEEWEIEKALLRTDRRSTLRQRPRDYQPALSVSRTPSSDLSTDARKDA